MEGHRTSPSPTYPSSKASGSVAPCNRSFAWIVPSRLPWGVFFLWLYSTVACGVQEVFHARPSEFVKLIPPLLLTLQSLWVQIHLESRNCPNKVLQIQMIRLLRLHFPPPLPRSARLSDLCCVQGLKCQLNRFGALTLNLQGERQPRGERIEINLFKKSGEKRLN